MMTRHLLFFCLFLFVTGQLPAQQLYKPRNIEAAYQQGTRSETGKPGENYWQNEADYQMDIRVDPATRQVSGSEQIHYRNNSPDTLRNLVIRFVNNVHKPGAVRASKASDDFLTEGLHIHRLLIAGEVYEVDAKDWGTEASISLKQAVLPHSETQLTIDWSYPLSKESGREGQLDSSSFFVAYSYPRVSVYDDYNGWDMLPHNGRQEFYNDFNNYNFSVTVPKNYVVWATGDLLNAEEVLQAPIAKRLKQSYTSDEVIKIASTIEMHSGKVTQQKDWNTWKFKATHIPDVAFALSNHYQWDASSTVVDIATGRRASTQAAYTDAAKDFQHSVEWNNYALHRFSTQWPGVPYPYAKMTAVQGFADMEFPMMVNDTPMPDNLRFARLIQDHEVAHTYFPFYMGINETRYAYMDEGWATTFEYLIGIDEFGKEDAGAFYKRFRVRPYITNPATEEDQPVITLSSQVSGYGYGHNSYGKASLAYLALKDLLGDALFKKALHYYMDAWHGKHPIPWDFFNAINAGAGQDLNWFWQNWFFSNYYIDLAIQSADQHQLVIHNQGGFAIPFDVIIRYRDGSQETKHQSPLVWRTMPRDLKIDLTGAKAIQSITLDGGLYMDATPKDNQWLSSDQL